ncbi:MAG: hypothetical protein IKJ45_10340, partial [Kiritimatiellae bacterium]|nr:hypothetical protein [Kiritimatiellia bacterium]
RVIVFAIVCSPFLKQLCRSREADSRGRRDGDGHLDHFVYANSVRGRIDKSLEAKLSFASGRRVNAAGIGRRTKPYRVVLLNALKRVDRSEIGLRIIRREFKAAGIDLTDAFNNRNV